MLVLAKTPEHIKRPRNERKICQFKGCGAVFYGHFISKYCPDHRGQKVYNRNKSCFAESPNQTIKHGMAYATKAKIPCHYCGDDFEVMFMPRVETYPKYCTQHRPTHRRTKMSETPEIKASIEAEIIDSLPEVDESTIGDVVSIPLSIDNGEPMDIAEEIRSAHISIENFMTNGLVDSDDDDDVVLINPKTGEVAAVFRNGSVDDIVASADVIDSIKAASDPMDCDEPVSVETAAAADVKDSFSDLVTQAKVFFDPNQAVHIDNPSSDDDAGIVRPGVLGFRTVLADGKAIEYAKASSAGFSVELSGFVAIDKDPSGRPVSVRVTDFYTEVDDAMATIETDDFGTYYCTGEKRLEINSGTPEISVDDIVKRRFNEGWKRV